VAGLLQHGLEVLVGLRVAGSSAPAQAGTELTASASSTQAVTSPLHQRKQWVLDPRLGCASMMVKVGFMVFILVSSD